MVLPRTVSHYEVLEIIGQGGMGEVCRALDQRLGRVVAIKFQSAELLERADSRERFLNEGRTLSLLSHPNIATIHEADDTGGRPFLVMEYLPGGTLKAKVRAMATDGGVPEDLLLRWCLSLSKAIEHAHRHGVLHRDIKTSNAMFDEEGRLKLTDFGLARSTLEAEATQSTTLSGTFGYMAPELLMGEPPSEQSDLYSLGMTFYEMAAGDLPFAGSSQASLIHRILHEPPASLETKRPDLPTEFLRLVGRLLSKRPQDRPENATDVVAALAAIGSRQGDLTVTLPPVREIGVSRRRLWRIGGLAATAVAGLALVGVLREPVTQMLQRADLPPKRYIAVLPFHNIDAGGEQQALCDGLMETLTTALSRRTRMQVVAPSEVRRIESAEQARREFGVNLVLTGSLQVRTSGHRLTLRLVDAETRRQLDVREIDGVPGEVVQFEEAILLEMANMLDAGFETPAGVLYAGAAPSPGAWDMYLRGRGFVYRFDKEGNLDRAMQAFEDALRLAPRLVRAWAGKAEALLLIYRLRREQTLLDQARSAAAMALQLDPGYAEARTLLGAALVQARQFDLAEKELETARITAPDEPAVYRELAGLYRARGQEDRAEGVFRQYIAARPEDWRGYNSLGVVFSRLGRYDEAESQFRRVVELVPDNHMGYRNLGGAYLQMGRYRDSEKASKKAAALRPSATAWSNLGALYLIERRYSDAVRALEEAWRLMPREAPRDYRIPGNLGEAYRFSKAPSGKSEWAYRQAIQIAERQLTGTPGDASLHSSLALYLAGAGEPAKAVEQIEEALRSRPEDSEIRYRAAVVFAQTANVTRAIAEVREALVRDYSLTVIQDAPLLAPVRAHPEFRNLVQEFKPQRR